VRVSEKAPEGGKKSSWKSQSAQKYYVRSKGNILLKKRNSDRAEREKEGEGYFG